MAGEENWENPKAIPEDGILLEKSGIRLLAPELLGPPRCIQVHGSFPLGDFSHWQQKHIPIFGVVFKSVVEFYAQLNIDETNNVLDRITAFIRGRSREELVKLHESFAGSLQTGMDFENSCVPCLALFPGDNEWYRARIVEDIGNGVYRVLFVDFGNSEKLSSKSLIQCPDDIRNFIEGATCCAIAGFSGNESHVELKALKKLLTEKDLVGKIESVSEDTKGCKFRMVLAVYDLNGTPIKDEVERVVRHKQAKKERKARLADAVSSSGESTPSSSADTPSGSIVKTRKLCVKTSSPILKELSQTEIKTEPQENENQVRDPLETVSPRLSDSDLASAFEIPALVARDIASVVPVVGVPETTFDSDAPVVPTAVTATTASATATMLIAPRTATIQLDQQNLAVSTSGERGPESGDAGIGIDIRHQNIGVFEEELEEKLEFGREPLLSGKDAWILEKNILEETWNLKFAESDKYFHQILHEKTRVMDCLQRELVQVKSDHLKADHQLRHQMVSLQRFSEKRDEALHEEIRNLKALQLTDGSAINFLKKENQDLIQQGEALRSQINELLVLNSQFSKREEEIMCELNMREEEHKKIVVSMRNENSSQLKAQRLEWTKKFEESEVKLQEIFNSQLAQLCNEKMAVEQKLKLLTKEKDDEIHKMKEKLEAQQLQEVKSIPVVAEPQQSKCETVGVVAAAAATLSSDVQAEYESRIEEQNAAMLQLSTSLASWLKSSQKDKSRLEKIIEAKNAEIAAFTKNNGT